MHNNKPEQTCLLLGGLYNGITVFKNLAMPSFSAHPKGKLSLQTIYNNDCVIIEYFSPPA